VEQRGRQGAVLSGVLSEVRTVAATGSTNSDLLELARAGAVEGLWLRAESQLAGRGRQGRTWASPLGNLYGSTLVRLRPGDPVAGSLALVAAVALREAVGIGAIKWPNDLLIDGAKVAGILLERGDDAVVAGFGVNLVQAPNLPDRRTTTLRAAGIELSAVDLVEVLAARFAVWLDRWREPAVGAVAEAWLAYAHPAGTPLSVNLPDGSRVEGRFDGLAPDGALALRLASGERRTIHAGDVFQL
jgi:BirA family biotin operon repressor/biotin-[acetyl-CoA-carboxylase] ligase